MTNNTNNAATFQTSEEGFGLGEWSQSKRELFDLSADFQATIEPMMDALAAKCKELGVPVVILAASGQNEKAADYHLLSHIPNMGRAPHVMLTTLSAAQGDIRGVHEVLMANHIRNLRNEQTTH